MHLRECLCQMMGMVVIYRGHLLKGGADLRIDMINIAWTKTGYQKNDS